MKQISSKATFFKKYVLPIAWVGVLVINAIKKIAEGGLYDNPVPIVALLLFAVVIAYISKKIFWEVADKVFDCGDHLIVKWNGKEESIGLTNVMNVNSEIMVNPKITLLLITPGTLGSEFSFYPPPRGLFFNPLTKHPLAEELIRRVHQSRSAVAL